ncbi:phosphotransferase [Mesomycoplasma conjunctivae]|uniref:phosphotransferase n=1 Tax=Mesomycoplasma conjunctivae TaxID=45361 RepID=UPI003DA3720A
MKELEQKIPTYIFKHLRKIELIYCGYHNCSYRAFYKDEKVQIRIAKNNFANWKNESIYLEGNTDFIFYKNGNFIKKWYEGDILNKTIAKENQRLLFQKILDFQEQKPSNIEQFDWNILNITDQKYCNILKKYQNEQLVLNHGDLCFKNIIFNKKTKEIKFIDFEWVRYNSKYFDLVCLHLYMNIDKDEIISYFNLDRQKFADYVYLIKTFNKYWNLKFY